MNSAARYSINRPKVIFEFFDDEVVIVNLESGCYYSADKTGFAIFFLPRQQKFALAELFTSSFATNNW